MIHDFSIGDEKDISKLINRVFDEFVGIDYSETDTLQKRNGIKFIPMKKFFK